MNKARLPIHLVQFDLDGTLIDSLPQLWQAINIMRSQLGFSEVSAQTVQLWIGNGADILVQRALADAQQTPPKASLIKEGRVLFADAYQSVAHQEIRLFPGVIETLNALKAAGLTLALVTNKPFRFVPDILAATQLVPFFSHALGGDSLAQKKPDPAPLLHTCQALNILPSHSIMVGDSENDVLAAKAAGMQVAGLTYGYNYGKSIATSQPDWVLDDIRGLIELVKNPHPLNKN
ncbi:phosphoglycolate phosphatase [Oceanisphaera avium]|uniref:Phosphoglycolate phosphatase n=1 Tax=Oceanisphaera avium TaxID=1903694 RepID=A0A1Y0D048_9GAMM|nr:phosphoglycolate phosphatase [Oceanisphaera avium]ART80960.1 phosphoglycolate phosphatase [Oceanisphaera avium]